MAVAADSHRDFLIPERTFCSAPDNEYDRYSDALRLFFCNMYYITREEIFQDVLNIFMLRFRKNGKNTLTQKDICDII